MQNKSNNNKAIQEPNDNSVSIGAVLVNARNAAALSQTDVAEQINLPRHIIRDLEADDFESLPESTYIRGYLRNYARVVGIDADSLINTYIEQHYQEPVVEENRRSKQSYDPAILWSTAAVFSILIGLVITWWFDANQVAEQSVELVSTEVVAKGNTTADVLIKNAQNASASIELTNEVAVQAEERSLTDTEQSANSVAEEITADQQNAMEEASRNPTLVTSVGGSQILTVTYVEKSWTEIRDADSNTLMQGLIEPGVVRNLSGKPPFEIFLGNAPGVVIEVNGLYFDHSQYSRSNRTARFQVSSSSLN